MTDEQQAAYIISQAACAVIEAMGMKAKNQIRKDAGLSLAYGPAQFNNLIDKYGISHNSVLRTLRGG